MSKVKSSDRTGFRSGELAKAAGVSRDTLRHYERKGIMQKPRRSANNYREYPQEALVRVQVVRRALAVGFTLDELSRIFRKRDAGEIPCRHVRDLAALKLARFHGKCHYRGSRVGQDYTSRLPDDGRTCIRS